LSLPASSILYRNSDTMTRDKGLDCPLIDGIAVPHAVSVHVYAATVYLLVELSTIRYMVRCVSKDPQSCGAETSARIPFGSCADRR
jgi:hypothetical protein